MINLNDIYLNRRTVSNNNNNNNNYNDENQDPNNIEFYDINATNYSSRNGTINNIDNLQKFNANQSLITDSSFNEPSLPLQYDDSREHTSDIIYELNRRKHLAGKLRHRLVLLVSTLLCIGSCTTIGLLQYDEYFALMNYRVDYFNQTHGFCNAVDFNNIDIISTPIAGALLLFYIVLFKRRVFLRYKFKYRNVGLPMFISIWNKSDRLMSAFTYGLIAFNIFQIVKNVIESKENNAQKYVPFKDPSGLINLAFKIIEMFLIGIRYYPILVAQRANTFVINITAAVYMAIDYGENMYQFGKCDSIFLQVDDLNNLTEDDKDEIKRKLPYFIIYKVASSIPLFIFSSFILVDLIYKSMINIFDFVIRYASYWTKSKLIERAKDSFFCLVMNVDDEDEMFYSNHDLNYVFELFNLNKHNNKIDTDADSSFEKIQQGANSMLTRANYIKKYSRITKKKPPLIYKIIGFIYPIDPHFRFTSKYLNTIIVALVALYYTFLYFAYTMSTLITFLVSILPDEINLDDLPEINIGEILCSLAQEICIEPLSLMGPIKIPVPSKVKKYFGIYPELKSSLNAIIIVPVFAALLICLLQLLFLLKDTKTHLKQLYKGQCEFVLKAKNLSNPSIASSSFHFGGYVVGYMVWGYIIMYVVLVIIGFVILLLRIFAGDQFFASLALRLVPVVTVIIVKMIINYIFTRFIFLYRDSNVLALKNFRAFNVFLYFNFYFDCFMGVISAIIRLVKSAVIALIMMPRISYSFMGRHFERSDNGYGCYSGFLHMEAMHTNPVLNTFLSLLYYKSLSEHIRRYKIEKIIFGDEEDEDHFLKVKKFRGKLSLIGPADPNIMSKVFTAKLYKKRIVNKWHLLFFLSRNPRLIYYRKHFIEKHHHEKKPNLFQKIKTCCVAKCKCFRKNHDNNNNDNTTSNKNN